MSEQDPKYKYLFSPEDAHAAILHNAEGVLVGTAANPLVVLALGYDPASGTVAVTQRGYDLVSNSQNALLRDAAGAPFGVSSNPLIVSMKGYDADSDTVKVTQRGYDLVSNSQNALLRNAAGLELGTLANPIYTFPWAYDEPSSSLKVTSQVFECDFVTLQASLLDTTGLLAGAIQYFPSSAGILVGKQDTITFEYDINPGQGGEVLVWWEATLQSSSPFSRSDVLPKNITLSGSSYTTGGRCQDSVLSGSAVLSDVVSFDNLNMTRLRMAIRPVGADSGTVVVSYRTKVRGG